MGTGYRVTSAATRGEKRWHPLTFATPGAFRELASLLRSQARHNGVTLVEGEAELSLGERLAAVASQFGVTERTVLASYLSEDAISLLARTLGSMAGDYREATQPIG